MRTQHLSDEAVAACADGVLRGHPRERASRHIDDCAECRAAVREQREAVFALRAAPAPAIPAALTARLRSVPMTTPIRSLPTVLTPDGTTMLSTFASPAAFVAMPPTPTVRNRRAGRPLVAGAAVVALAGALVAGSAAGDAVPPAQTGNGSVVRDSGSTPATGGQPLDVAPVNVFRANRP